MPMRANELMRGLDHVDQTIADAGQGGDSEFAFTVGDFQEWFKSNVLKCDGENGIQGPTSTGGDSSSEGPKA